MKPTIRLGLYLPDVVLCLSLYYVVCQVLSCLPQKQLSTMYLRHLRISCFLNTLKLHVYMYCVLVNYLNEIS